LSIIHCPFHKFGLAEAGEAFDNEAMRPIRSLVIYVALVFGGGALLAPWLYLGTQWAAARWPALAPLAGNPFYRFVLRSILGLAVLALWPLLRNCRMLNRRELGLANAAQAPGQLAAGFGIGFGSLACAAVLAICCRGRNASLAHSGPEFAHFLAGTTAAAVVVAILEELIFRAGLFGVLRKCSPWPLALAVSSAVYASVHFLQKAPAPSHMGWLTGLQILPQMFRTPADGLAPVPAFFTLLVAGAILALTYQKTGSLFMSIGLHAGWIFWLKSYRFLTQETPGAARSIWGSDKLLDGWLPLLILAVVLAAMLRNFHSRPSAKSDVKC
jgi:membrane protease YdiL (CAAX protease family)